jgi:hypothetical protein
MADTILEIVGYQRDFNLPGAPVTWTVRLDHEIFGRRFANVIQIAETDEKLNAIATELATAEGKVEAAVWDEATLIEATKRGLALTAEWTVQVKQAPIMAATKMAF